MYAVPITGQEALASLPVVLLSLAPAARGFARRAVRVRDDDVVLAGAGVDGAAGSAVAALSRRYASYNSRSTCFCRSAR